MSDSDTSAEDEPLFIQPLLKAKKGRGAVSNLQGRYELLKREAIDDGWSQGDAGGCSGADAGADCPADGSIDVDAEADSVSTWKTQVIEERAKTILSRNQSPDVPFSISLNPYRGCEHGCIYCFARPTHSYLGLSPGLDFESKIFAKVNAPELLRRELAKASYVPEPIALGVNTDAYQPCERELRLTRRVLEVLHECEHPVALITKSSLIERDIDLLAEMASRRQAMAAVTITTLDPAVARTLEPRAAAPARRLRTIRTLTDAGIPVGVSVAPIIPFVTEPDLERILAAAAEAGAINAGYVMLRLPWEVSPLFRQWLEAHFPDRATRVMNRVRDMRGGKDYDASFGTRMHGEGIWADVIRQRFEKTVARLGMGVRSGRFKGLDSSRFHPPSVASAVAPPAKATAKIVSSAVKSGKSGGQRELF
ncbi:PA0069 family radical SAM protein [Nitrosospira sp. Nsp1]|uniref:PA0069 family radical SAM protein n=1 Tax=Nitrosospira sp. Nsp1 TaxID=136547 RepID=UPI0008900AF7|nr:PA0069 family radical SAM protein [Nitrosospira sp. Nsp1]SCX40177.1 DNA repair photolyase [Nitrosospira sp. Nsp1]